MNFKSDSQKAEIVQSLPVNCLRILTMRYKVVRKKTSQQKFLEALVVPEPQAFLIFQGGLSFPVRLIRIYYQYS